MQLQNNNQQIIPPLSAYATSLGKELAKKYNSNLERVVNKINDKIISHVEEIDFIPKKGIGFFAYVNPLFDANPEYGVDSAYVFGSIIPPKGKYFGVNIYFKKEVPSLKDVQIYNIKRYLTESSAFILNLFAKDVLEILMQEPDIMKDDNIEGIALSVAWEDKNNVGDYIEIYTPKQGVERYLKKELTFPELLETSKICGCNWDHIMPLNSKEIVKGLSKIE